MSRLQQALLAAGAVIVLLVASLHFVVVSVDARGPDGTKFWLPVPLELAQLAVWLTPDINEYVDVDTAEIERYQPILEALLDGLEEVDDAELVRVEDGDQTVVVRKSDGDIHVSVETGREDVRVQFSMRTLQGLVDSFDDGRFDVAAALRALKHSSGPLVYVDEPDTKVTLALW
jgi:hypothetical protein